MNRFGEIPITPDDQQGRPGKNKQEAEPLPAEPQVSSVFEPNQAEDQDDTSREDAPAAELQGEPDGGPPPFGRHPRSRVVRKKKRPQPRRTVRIAAWLLLVPVAIVLFYWAASYFFVPLFIKGPLARSLGQRLDRPVEISRAVFSPFTLRLFLEEITIGPVVGDRNEQRLLELARIDCRIALDRIFSGILVCEGVAVRDLLMRINRDAAVSSDLADTWRLVIPSANRSAASLWPSWLLPGEITLTGGTVVVDDPTAQKQYRIEQIELYLPPLDPKKDAADRLPRLSAVINASPVQVEAVREVSSSGQVETSFDLKIKSVVLANYLQALPVLDQRLRLAEGQADLELRLIFPQTGSGGQRILLEGSSTLAALKVVDQQGADVFSVPAARFDFQIAPLAQRFRFSRITLEKPLLNLTAGAVGEKYSGLTMAELGSTLLTPVRLPLNLGIEQLQLTGGQVQVTLPGPNTKKLVWNEVEATLEHFASPGVSLEEKKGGPALFSFKAVDNSDSRAANLSAAGEILPDGIVSGQAELDGFDPVRYQDLLPRTGWSFNQGVGALRFVFASTKPGAGDKEKKEVVSTFLVRDGELSVTGYALSLAGKKAAAGESLRCGGLQADTASRRLSCSSLEFADSDIFAPGPLAAVLGKPAQGKIWQLDVRDLQVKGARLHVPLLRKLCTADKDLVLKNFSLEAKDLTAENAANAITAQGAVGAKGSVKVSGGYSLAQNKGDLQLSLQHLDFALFDSCLKQTVIPTVKKGTINIQGDVSLPAAEFAGQVWVNDMVAGEENGPSVSWQLATADRVTLRTAPLHLDLGEIMVRKPLVRPGLIDSENLLRNFLHPGKPTFQSLAISKISIEDGQFSPIWPVLLPGYQPRLAGINGSLASPGRKSMPFTLSGKVGEVGNFLVTGKAAMDRIEEYALDMPAVNLVPFADFFLTNMGMSVESARGRWQQTMSRADNVATVVTDTSFQGLQPVVESPLLRVSALLLGNNGVLELENRAEVADGSESTFLLTSVQRQLQRQKIRIDISEALVLREYFPELQLPPQISFAPGLAEPLAAEGLAGYRELFALRPYLGLRLHAVIDKNTDREALRRDLQEEADLKLEAENSRRALLELQREEREKQRLAEIKAGRTPVVSEEIAPEELAGDLEPLPYVQVEVTEAMLAELAIRRLHAVQGYLQKELAIDPARVQVGEGFSDGPPQVQLRLVPSMAGKKL
ncbi:MAG: DUF748 domain-containing protein [Desulfobulbaceae bacterium]